MAPKTAMRTNPGTLFFDSYDSADDKLEVLDAVGLPLIFMPSDSVLRQGLGHRGVLVGLDAGKRTMLCRQSETRGRPRLWDVPAQGLVRPDESREEAALRHLAQSLGIVDISLSLRYQSRPTATQKIEISYFQGALGKRLGRFRAREDVLLVDADEFSALVREVPELLSIRTIWLYQSLFSVNTAT